jgi:hypothetical protein
MLTEDFRLPFFEKRVRKTIAEIRFSIVINILTKVRTTLNLSRSLRDALFLSLSLSLYIYIYIYIYIYTSI